VVLLTCSYRTAEFIRIGYYVSNDYTDPDMKENNPSPPKMDQLQRNILATNPRVTKFKINWDNNTSDNSENIPPPKVDPNQMSSENSQSMEGPLKSASNGGLVTQSQTVVGMDTD